MMLINLFISEVPIRVNLMQMTNDEISGQLKNIFHEENIAYEDEAINMISKHADGSMRDALSLADRVINYTNGNVSRKINSNSWGHL